jgi:hypothetical protein
MRQWVSPETETPRATDIGRAGRVIRSMNVTYLLWLKFQGRGVDTITQPCRSRSVGKDMAEMAIAFRAQHFGAHHAMRHVAFLRDMSVARRRSEARPAAAGIELGIGFEQGLAASCIGVSSRRKSASLFSTLAGIVFVSVMACPSEPAVSRVRSVGDLGAAHQRRLLDIVLSKDLLQVLDLRNIVIRNIGLVRV